MLLDNVFPHMLAQKMHYPFLPMMIVGIGMRVLMFFM